MRALQVTGFDGPDGLVVAEQPEPPPAVDDGGDQVIIEVHAAGVAFPDLLLSRGLYQLRPEPPFVPGMEVAGIVLHAPPGSDLGPGDRVAAFTELGGFAEVAVAPSHLTFPLPDELDFAAGAGLVLNYHTAVFALVTRGRLEADEQVLVRGAAGGVGTAALQVARGLGARTIAVVSSDEKMDVARQAGADHVVRSDGSWREAARELSGGGVDVVIDPVGGDGFVDSLRSLRPGGRAVVVGFAAGTIPQIKVNRLLLNNVEVVGAAWREWVTHRPAAAASIGAVVTRLVGEGAIAPVVGARFPLADGAEALRLIERRAALGKVVLDVQ
jgi:NADPH2:quinone reductase